jgi:hypothetical protein
MTRSTRTRWQVVTSGRLVRPAAGGAGRVPSFRCRGTRAERLVHGTPLDPNTLDQVRGAARLVGLADAEIERAIIPTATRRES